MKRYDSVQPWQDGKTASPAGDYETIEPRSADLVGDLVVPVGQMAVTSALLGGVVAWLVGQLVPAASGHLFEVWLGAALLTGAVSWLLLLTGTLRRLETRIGVDLDGDGQVGPPQERLVFVGRERARAESAQARREDEWSQFVQFVRELPHRGTAVAAWQKTLGRDRYQTYRDALLDYGFARWNSYKDNGKPNTSQGWSLVVDVADILSQLHTDVD